MSVNEHLVVNELPLKIRKAHKNYVAECDLCGKQKLYILTGKERFHVYCHKCVENRKSLKNYIKEKYPQIYERFYGGIYFFDLERRFERKQRRRKESFNDVICDNVLEPIKGCCKLIDLPKEHFAIKYIRDRLIPENHIRNLFYTDSLRSVILQYTENVSDKMPEHDPRILIPFWNKDKTLEFFQARSILPEQKMRYFTIKVKPFALKIWGLHQIIDSKPIFITEGPFDAMFLTNSLAIAGSNIANEQLLNLFPKLEAKDLIFVYDNELKTNKEIAKEILNKIEYGFSVVIWPQDLREKDINEIVLKSSFDLNKINELVFSGITAKIKLKLERTIAK